MYLSSSVIRLPFGTESHVIQPLSQTLSIPTLMQIDAK